MLAMALMSLFLLGWMLDQVKGLDPSTQDQSEIAIYYQLIDGFHWQLEKTAAEEIEQLTEQLARQYGQSLQLIKSNELILPQSLQSQLSQPGGLTLESESGPYLVKQLIGNPEYLLKLSIPWEEPVDKMDLILTLSFYLGLSLMMLLWLAPLTRRLILVHKTAAEFGRGHLRSRIPHSTFSYIGPLEKSFNRMATQIEELIAENKLLAGSLSHDLRTPLACLRFGIEAAVDTENPTKKNEYINRMDDDLQQMEEMVEAFLEYAGLEKQSFQLRKKTLFLDELVTGIQRQSQPILAGKPLQLDLCNPRQQVNVDPIWINRALVNLVNNSARYAKNRVILSTLQQQQVIEIRIEDDGPGIPEEQWQNIFKPFVKLEASRTRKQGNYGLGLAIVSKVCLWHNGAINVGKSEKLGGACFTLTLPVANSSDSI